MLHTVYKFLRFITAFLVQLELEALGQCIPPPRHVLPVPPSGESAGAADLCPLATFHISQSGKQSLHPESVRIATET